jgi:hypothetical protein
MAAATNPKTIPITNQSVVDPAPGLAPAIAMQPPTARTKTAPDLRMVIDLIERPDRYEEKSSPSPIMSRTTPEVRRIIME